MVEGEVIKFNREGGWGIICTKDSKYFFHINNVLNKKEIFIVEGTLCSFELIPHYFHKNEFQAGNITLL